MPSTIWSNTFLCANRREPAQQVWPWYAHCRAGNGAVELGVGKYDRRRLAAKFERDLLEVSRRGLHDQLADLSRAGESHLVHEIV
jgi:hypothetical protein